MLAGEAINLDHADVTTWIVQTVLSEDPAIDIEIRPLQELDSGSAEGAWVSHAELRSHLNTDLFALVRGNVAVHRLFVNELTARFRAGTLGDDGSMLSIQAVTHLMNFAASVHALQEHSEIRAVRQGGRELRAQVHQVFRDAYNEMPDVFLVRRLRDVMVHSGFEGLVHIRGTSRLLEPAVSGPVDMQMQVFLASEPLMKNDRITAALRAHIGALGDEIDVSGLMERALSGLGVVHNRVVPMYRPRLIQEALEWARFMAVLHGSGVDPATCSLLRQAHDGPFDPTKPMTLAPITGDHGDLALRVAAQVYGVSI